MATDARSRSRLAGASVDLASIAIALLVTLTQVLRPSPRDAVLFGLVAAALLLDLARARAAPGGTSPGPAPHAPALTRRAVGIVALLGLVLALAPRRSGLDAAALGVVGAAAVVIAWTPGTAPAAAPGPWSPERRRAASAWAVVTLVLCLWELTAFVLGLGRAPGTTPPAVSDVLDPWLDHLGPRALFVAAWLAVLGYLLRRGRR